MRPLFFVAAALLVAVPAQAQTVPCCTYQELLTYARFGALSILKHAIDDKEFELACSYAQHLQKLESMGTPVSTEEARRTQKIVNARCN